MILRFLFVSMFLPVLELYVKLFSGGEKIFRRYSGKKAPGVPEHLHEWQE